MTSWIALALAFPGFAVLSLAMERHREELLDRPLAAPAMLGLRGAGAGLLVLSLVACLTRWNASVALAVWAGVLTAAAMALGLMLTYVPRAVLPAAAVGGLAGAAGWLAMG